MSLLEVLAVLCEDIRKRFFCAYAENVNVNHQHMHLFVLSNHNHPFYYCTFVCMVLRSILVERKLSVECIYVWLILKYAM